MLDAGLSASQCIPSDNDQCKKWGLIDDSPHILLIHAPLQHLDFGLEFFDRVH
jgi:hypothetical protein